MTTHAPFATSMAIGLGNMAAALAGAKIIHLIIEESSLRRYSEFFAIAGAAITASMVSATIGSFSLFFAGIVPWQSITYSWYTWWSGDAVGMLIILPLTLEFLYPEKRNKSIGLSGILFMAFLLGMVSLFFIKNLNQAFAWSLCPVFILMSFQNSNYFTRFVLLLTSIIVVSLVSFGFGPFEYGNLNLNFIYVQTLLSSYAFSVLFAKPFSIEYKVGKPFVIGNLIGWASLFVVIFKITQVEKNHLFDDLHKTTENIMASLEKENLQYERLMDSGEALLRIKKNPSGEDWRIFADSIDFSTQYPGINGYGVFQKVLKKDYPAFQKEMISRGMRPNNLRILDYDFSTSFDDHYVIYMVEPAERNRTGVGIDVGSERKRRIAIMESLKREDTVVTGTLKLIINEDIVPGFLIIHPVTAPDMPPTWIYAPVITQNYYDEVLRPYFNLFNIRIIGSEKKVIYESKKTRTGWQNDSFLIRQELKVFNRKYQLEIYPTANFFNRHSGSSSAMAFLLNLFMLFIIGFLLEQITFGKRAEALVIKRTKELDESKTQLVHSSKMASLGEMASGMAHEINNPLTIITGKIKVITSMLSDLKESRPEIFTEIERVDFTVDRISKIVKGLKSFSRSAIKDPFELVALKDIMTETLALCAEKFKAEGINLKIADIPNAYIQCRSAQISQVLLNLLNNSRDAVEELKERWIEINFELLGGNRLIISILDSGRGIPHEIVDKMMEPFFTTKVVGRGTGLGLSIAKGIVEDHNGKLYLDMNSPHTRFVIELPV